MAELLRFRDDPLPDEPAVSLDAFLDQTNAASVRIEAGDDVRRLGPVLGRVRLIEVDFPKFRDGRGFSSARVLREMGYTGEIRAIGDFLYDQVNYQHRVGFDAWEVPDHFTLEMFNRALTEMTNVYQPSSDGKKTIRELRASR